MSVLFLSDKLEGDNIGTVQLKSSCSKRESCNRTIEHLIGIKLTCKLYKIAGQNWNSGNYFQILFKTFRGLFGKFRKYWNIVLMSLYIYIYTIAHREYRRQELTNRTKRSFISRSSQRCVCIITKMGWVK